MASRKAKPREKTSERRVQSKLETAAPMAQPIEDDNIEADSDPDPNPPKKAVLPSVPPPPRSSLPGLNLDLDHLEENATTRPSSTMTREMPALVIETLVSTATSAEGSDSRVAAVPPAAPTIRAMDELAITTEAPSVPRALLLDTTEALLERISFAELSEETIAVEAGVSIDVFHAHFTDKAKLLAALADRFCEQSISVTNESTHSGIWDSVAPRDVIEVSVRSILDVVLGRAPLVRAVLMSGDQVMIDGFRRVGTNITARVIRVIEHSKVAPSSDRPEARDVAFAFLLAVSLAHHSIIVGTDWCGVDFNREELYERATLAATSYLESSMKIRSVVDVDAKTTAP